MARFKPVGTQLAATLLCLAAISLPVAGEDDLGGKTRSTAPSPTILSLKVICKQAGRYIAWPPSPRRVPGICSPFFLETVTPISVPGERLFWCEVPMAESTGVNRVVSMTHRSTTAMPESWKHRRERSC